MSTFDYARSKKSADRLVAKFGQVVSLRRIERVGGVPWDPTSGTLTAVYYTTKAAIVEFEQNEIDGTAILATDRKAIMAVGDLTITPTTTDTFVIGDGSDEAEGSTIVRVMPVNPGGTVVVYELQIRD